MRAAEPITIFFESRAIPAYEGETVAAAVAAVNRGEALRNVVVF